METFASNQINFIVFFSSQICMPLITWVRSITICSNCDKRKFLKMVAIKNVWSCKSLTQVNFDNCDLNATALLLLKQELVRLIQIHTKFHVCKGQQLPYCRFHLENADFALVAQTGNQEGEQKHHHFPTKRTNITYMTFPLLVYNDTNVSTSPDSEATRSSFFN